MTEPDAALLNHALELGPSWLQPIQARLRTACPQLTQVTAQGSPGWK